MALPTLIGPKELTRAAIDEELPRKVGGAYVIGTRTPEHVMLVPYAGRSDDDIAGRLKTHIGNYDAFSYILADSPKQAYELHCEIYHELKPSKNPQHPHKPSGVECVCPVCGR
jgi:hypothetical protein